VPVLGAYSLGKAQEVLLSLHRAAPELPFVLHRSAAEMTEIYRECGFGTPRWETLADVLDLEGKVIIAPPNTFRSQQLWAIENRRTAVISGWGADGSAKYRYGVEEVFPLSDHADYDDLLRYVEMVNPDRVLTLHEFADEFAADLRRRGREAWSFTGANQLELALDDIDGG
jgi:DNA ligase-1